MYWCRIHVPYAGGFTASLETEPEGDRMGTGGSRTLQLSLTPLRSSGTVGAKIMRTQETEFMIPRTNDIENIPLIGLFRVGSSL